MKYDDETEYLYQVGRSRGCLRIVIILLLMIVVWIVSLFFVSCGAKKHKAPCEAYGNGKYYHKKNQ
jgi:hypothetical protein